MTDWLFDLGNTRLKCAQLHADGRIGQVYAVAHDGNGLPGGWADKLPARIESAHVASVVAPVLRTALIDGLASRCGRISLACTLPRMDGVRIAYAEPARLGVDRFLALLGAKARGASPCLVVGVGTALTLDLLAADGRHLGGRIAPSPQLMRQALQLRAPHLPAQGGNYTEFAADTDDALASGCEGAALALIDRSREVARARLGVEPRVLLHGGGADGLLAHLERASVAPTLVLEGLARWAQMETGRA